MCEKIDLEKWDTQPYYQYFDTQDVLSFPALPVGSYANKLLGTGGFWLLNKDEVLLTKASINGQLNGGSPSFRMIGDLVDFRCQLVLYSVDADPGTGSGVLNVFPDPIIDTSFVPTVSGAGLRTFDLTKYTPTVELMVPCNYVEFVFSSNIFVQDPASVQDSVQLRLMLEFRKPKRK